MFALASLLACTPPADAPPGGPGSPKGAAADPDGGPNAGAQAARGAPTFSAAWDGPWTVTVHAADPRDAGATALAAGLALPVQAWTGGRPRTRPGEAAVLWLPAGADLDATSRALAPTPGPQGDVVVVLAPGDTTWAATAAEKLPWAGVALVDPAVSMRSWELTTPPPPLAGSLAAWEIAEHYSVGYHPAAGALPPGLDARLGPWSAALLGATDPRTRAEAVRAADDGARAAADRLAGDPCVAVRLAVAETTSDPAVRARLASDPDPLVRARAADALDDVGLLAPLVADPSSVVRVVATDRLARLAVTRPTDAGPALHRALASPDAYQRWKAAWGLGHVPGSAGALVPLLTDPDIDVRREAARSLGHLGDTAAVEPLLAALRDDNSFVRRWAAAALGDLRDPRARDALRVAADDPTALVAQSARRALAVFGERMPAPPFSPPPKPRDDAALDALIASPDATTRKDAAKFLAGRTDAGERLARLAADRDSEVRKSAVEAMGWSAETAAAALPFLADPDTDVRVTALDTLRRGGVGTVDVIAPLLAERDAEIRIRAAEALAVLGPSDALAALLTDGDERVRAAAAAVFPDRVDPRDPSTLVRRAAGRPDADPVAAAAPGTPLAGWADGVFAREDDLLHVRFSWNDPEDRPAAHRALRPPVIRPYGHPNRG